MDKIAAWLQAISTAVIAFLTLWVIFYSEVGDLAMQLLRTELWETKQEKQKIYKEKQELENQKRGLQAERDEFARQREEYVAHVVSARLGDLWLFGVKTLAAYKEIAELSQELLITAEKIKSYRSWGQGQNAVSVNEVWVRFLPTLGEIRSEKRSEWGELLLDWSGQWQCSKNHSYISQSYEYIKFDPVEYRRRLAEYHVLCFDELEDTVRQRIEVVDGKPALNIRDFSYRLLEWPGIKNTSVEVKKRIRSRLTNEISINLQLANVAIQLRVAKGASLKEISDEARRIQANIQIARDWLDKATKDRHIWTE